MLNPKNDLKKLKYIKNTFNSFKIKNEISSYLYSSPEKQMRIMNYLIIKKGKIQKK